MADKKGNVISLRDRLRSKTLGAGGKRKEEIVEIDGEKFVVRQPTVAQRSDILRRSKANTGDAERIDLGEIQIWATIHCTYTEEGEKVYETEDYEGLSEQPSGGFVDTLGAVGLRLMNAAAGDAKNSGETVGDSSSSA